MNDQKHSVEETLRTHQGLGMNDPGIEEREVLAVMISNPDAIPDIAKNITAGDFFYFGHKMIFEAILSLHEAKLAVDEVTLPNELQRRGQLADVGGMTYIIDVLLRSRAPVDFMGIVAMVKAHSKRRQMLQLASQLAAAAQADDRDATEQAIRQAQKLIAPAVPRNRWQIMPASDLKNLPPISWLLPGLIPDRGLTALYGRSGEGKSFYALDLCLKVSQFRPVVYIAAEGQSGYAKRVAAWTIHHKQSEGALHFCMGAVNLMDATDLHDFIEALRQYNPAMICVDTLARTMIGGDENSQRDMSLYIDACSQITDQIGCAVLLVHHIGKSGSSPRGSSVLPGACEQMIELTKEDDSIRIRFSKNKDEDGGKAFYLRPVEVKTPLGVSIVLIPEDKVIRTEGDELSQAQRMILTTLAKPINLEGAQSSDIEEQTGLTRPTIAHALNRLIERNFVERKSRGVYGLTPAGLIRVRSFDRVDPLDPVDRLDPEPIFDQDDQNMRDQEDQYDQVELFRDGKRVSYP